MTAGSLRDVLEDEALLDRLAARGPAGGDPVGILLSYLVARADRPLPPVVRARSPHRRRLLVALAIFTVGASGAGVAVALSPPLAPDTPRSLVPHSAVQRQGPAATPAAVLPDVSVAFGGLGPSTPTTRPPAHRAAGVPPGIAAPGRSVPARSGANPVAGLPALGPLSAPGAAGTVAATTPGATESGDGGTTPEPVPAGPEGAGSEGAASGPQTSPSKGKPASRPSQAAKGRDSGALGQASPGSSSDQFAKPAASAASTGKGPSAKPASASSTSQASKPRNASAGSGSAGAHR